jgi:hypothetical protein
MRRTYDRWISSNTKTPERRLVRVAESPYASGRGALYCQAPLSQGGNIVNRSRSASNASGDSFRGIVLNCSNREQDQGPVPVCSLSAGAGVTINKASTCSSWSSDSPQERVVETDCRAIRAISRAVFITSRRVVRPGRTIRCGNRRSTVWRTPSGVYEGDQSMLAAALSRVCV